MLKEVFFQKCIQCGHRSEDNSPICPDCMEMQERYEFACESCGFPSNVPAKVCGKCAQKQYRDRIRIVYKYKGAVKRLLREVKFSYRISGRDAISRMADTAELSGYDIITDVPSHYTRKMRRISHPAKNIAKHIAEGLGCEYKKILTRTRRTEYQYKLKKKQRASNVKNAFECNIDVRGLKILLVDDIITTGSTIEECSRILKRSGASKVDVYALAGGGT